MALTEEELQRLRDAAAGYEPEQEEPERFESGRESADGGGLDNPITATLVRGVQSVGMPLYNQLYDAVAVSLVLASTWNSTPRKIARAKTV